MISSSVRRNAASTKTFVAVIDENGVMIDSDSDPLEAYERARFASPTQTVVIDPSVYAEPDLTPNPAGSLRDAAERALAAAHIPKVDFRPVDWDSFDPLNNERHASIVEEARSSLRAYGRVAYGEILEAAKGRVERPQEEGEKGKRGGIAKQFNAGWVLDKLLRQNQKMAKVLAGETVMHDSIGLSLLPHGGSFRPPFQTGSDSGSILTDDGKRRIATYCLYSTAECRKVCLVNTGQRALESGAYASSYLFSKMLRNDPQAFLINLFDRCVHAFMNTREQGIAAYRAEHKGKRPPSDMEFYRFIRLNVLSDLPWELIAPGMIEALCEYSRRVVLGGQRHNKRRGLALYDYSKIPYRRGVEAEGGARYYDITWSFGGTMMDPLFDVIAGDREAAARAAVVFVKREETPVSASQLHGSAFYRPQAGKRLESEEQWLPWQFLGQRVWNGDLSDVRSLDPENVRIVGLTYKPPSYKVSAPAGSKKKFALLPIVPAERLDRELPRFLVRVRQPDPDAPPIVVATQDLDNRRLELPSIEELESMV